MAPIHRSLRLIIHSSMMKHLNHPDSEPHRTTAQRRTCRLQLRQIWAAFHLERIIHYTHQRINRRRFIRNALRHLIVRSQCRSSALSARAGGEAFALALDGLVLHT